jgi:hypothetical protein
MFAVPRALLMGKVEAVSCFTVGEVLKKDSKLAGYNKIYFYFFKEATYRLFTIQETVKLRLIKLLRTLHVK